VQLRAVAATRYVTPLREGGSLPALVEADDHRLDDDGLYVLELTGAGQGRMELDPAIGRAEPDAEIQDPLLASAGANLGVDFLPGALLVA
jgi:hypothetical protein